MYTFLLLGKLDKFNILLRNNKGFGSLLIIQPPGRGDLLSAGAHALLLKQTMRDLPHVDNDPADRSSKTIEDHYLSSSKLLRCRRPIIT